MGNKKLILKAAFCIFFSFSTIIFAQTYYSNDTRSDQATINSLIKDLDHWNYETKRKAAERLAEIGGPAVPELIYCLDKEEHPNKQQAAVDILIKIGAPAVKPLKIAFTNRYISQRLVVKILIEINAPQTGDFLIESLKSNDPKIRQVCAFGLGDLKYEKAVEPLIEALKDGDLDTRLSAIISLGKIGDKRALEPLKACLKENSLETISAALSAFGMIGDKSVTAAVVPLLQHTNKEICKLAIECLGKTGDSSAIEPLKKMMKSEDKDYQKASAFSLEEIGFIPQSLEDKLLFYSLRQNWDGLATAGGPAADVLMKAYKDENYAIEEPISAALIKIGKPAVDPLILYLMDADFNMRKIAAFSLGKIGDKKATDNLIYCLSDIVLIVRRATVVSLGEIGDPKAVDSLINCLNDYDDEMRELTVYALGAIKDKRAINPLKPFLSNSNRKMRSIAQKALSNIGYSPISEPDKIIFNIAAEDWLNVAKFGKPAVEPLLALIADVDDDIRLPVVDALGEIKDTRATEPILERLRYDKMDIVRLSAVKALGNIGDQRATEQLTKCLWDKEEQIRKAAVESIFQLRDQRAVEPMTNCLRTGNDDMKIPLIEMLGKFGNPKAIDPLIIFLGDKNQELKESAATSIEQIGQPAIAPVYRVMRINFTKYSANNRKIIPLCITFADLSLKSNACAEAEFFYQKTVETLYGLGNKDTPDMAYCLSSLGKLYYSLGNYSSAAEYMLESIKIKKRILEPNNPDTISSMDYLGAAYVKNADYMSAEKVYLEILNAREKQLGIEHPHAIMTMNILARVQKENGNYSAAESLANKTIKICEKKFPPNDLNLAASLNNKAGILAEIGNYKTAESLFLQSLKIYTEKQGQRHPDTASAMSDLAALYRKMKEYPKSEEYYKNALNISIEKLGNENIKTAQIQNSFAELYCDLKKYAEAEKLLQHSLAVKTKLFGESHPETAITLRNLGNTYYMMNNYENAQINLSKAHKTMLERLGNGHPETTKTFRSLANLYIIQKNYPDALSLIKQVAEAENKTFNQVISFSSEQERFKFLENVVSETGFFLSLCADYMRNEPQAQAAALEYVLARKGIILESMISEQQVLANINNPEIISKWQRLMTIRGQLAKMAFAQIETTPENYTVNDAKINLESECNEIQQDLARLCRQQKEQTALAPTTEQIATSLYRFPDNAALIEFVCYHPAELNAEEKKEVFSDTKYIAYILKPKDKFPQIVDLGAAHEIDDAVKDYRDTIQKLLTAQSEDKIRGMKDDYTKYAKRMSALVFDKITPYLQDVKQLCISPDGELNLLPFNALPDKNNAPLIKTYSIAILNSGRDLMTFKKSKGKGKLIIFANPNYDECGSLKKITDSSPSNAQFRSFPILRSFAKGAQFSPLPETRNESAYMRLLFYNEGSIETQQFENKEATEENLKMINSPRVLHLATHGFFLQDSELENMLLAKTRDLSVKPLAADSLTTKPASADFMLSNPMHRSGIALAGANRMLRSEKIPENEEDGIVTAEEIASLRLSNTELVVLSACNTGVGDIKKGEGVMGLRRAFAAAGAQTLIMTLWSVPDVQTKELMQNFYTTWLSGKTKNEALRKGQIQMIDEMEKKYGYAPPSHWAAFVLNGNPQ